MILYVLIAALVVYFVIWIATVKRTEKVLVAFAGSYDGTDVRKLPIGLTGIKCVR